MAKNDVSIKIIKGSITGSEDSTFAGSFAKEVADFIETVDGGAGTANVQDNPLGLGDIMDITYICNGNNHMTAIIAVSGSLP